MWVAFVLINTLAVPAWANHVHMHGGPFLGVILSVAVNPTDPKEVYCAAYGGGVFSSEDRGNSWTAINQGLPKKRAP